MNNLPLSRITPSAALEPDDSVGEEQHGVSRAMAASPDNGRRSGRSSPTVYNPYYTGQPRMPANGNKAIGLDRQELIRRKKAASRPTSPELERCKSPVLLLSSHGSRDPRPQSPQDVQDNHLIGSQIERPRSALHRGDFRERDQIETSFGQIQSVVRSHEPVSVLATSPVAPWHSDFPVSAFRNTRISSRNEVSGSGIPIPTPQRTRAVSSASLLSSFVYKPPTSPLVYSSRPDTPDQSLRDRSRSPDKNRRHTFSPQMLHGLASAFEMSPGQARPLPPRHERTYPYQAHQPGRLHSHPASSSLPHTPLARFRRPSFSDSPLHHAPMVGSYEESILRGRMSTTPSKPLNFVAQIGVLGKGNCKPSLRCPPHVSVPFPAVFYSYSGNMRTSGANDQPSPYVGLIDLENSLQPSETPERRRQQRLQAALTPIGSRASSRARDEGSNTDNQAQRRRRHKQKRRSGSPRAPPGGCYRIPQTGQLQIVIKNPNKTAVKLFLVPYDLSDMEPGQKTFIRQRSYSAGPIIDMPLSSRKNLGTDRPEAAINPSGDPHDKPMLRYLIHLNICCPAKGRYFLFKSVRVVFANRVPDGKEKLRNEIQQPEPRYTPYKSGREGSATAVGPTGRQGSRRPSTSEPMLTPTEESHWMQLSRNLAQSLPTASCPPRFDLPSQALPHHFTILPTLESRPASRQAADIMEMDSDQCSRTTHSVCSPLSSPGSATQQGSVSQQHQNTWSSPRLADPFQFERDSSRERSMGRGRNESLLSRRLMDLAFHQGNNDGARDYMSKKDSEVLDDGSG